MVPAEDFLEIYGQTFKKIEGFYVVNYDIPFILTRHHTDTDMFVIAIRLKNPTARFSDVNKQIYQNLCKRKDINILDFEKRKNLAWYDQVRRTYHISKSHIEAMFDLTDYVFDADGKRVKYNATPLGHRLLQKGILKKNHMEEDLHKLKENPLVYLTNETGKRELVNIIREGRRNENGLYIEKSHDECCHLIDSIDWSNSHTFL